MNTDALRSLLNKTSSKNISNDETDEGYLSSSHGFLPRIAPHTSFFGSYPALDSILDDLPNLISEGTLQKALHSCTPTHFTTESIDPRDIRRMSTALGILAHGFVVEYLTINDINHKERALFRYDPNVHTTQRLPSWLWDSWNTINSCNQRLETSLSFTDLVINNWKKINPAQGMVVENLDILIPYTHRVEEKLFYMTFVETIAYSTPLLSMMLSFVESITDENDSNTKSTTLLQQIDTLLRYVTHVTFAKIDPLEHSPLYCDPVQWALFVSPLSMPIRKGEVGLSGAAIPFVHLLDAFFQRGNYDSKLGRNIRESHLHLPQRHKKLFTAINDLSIPSLVAQQKSSEITNLFAHVRQEYAGLNGWLGRHRLKVYGFMDAGFRLGRSSTNGGFSGSLKERAWDELDDHLNNARIERMGGTIYAGEASVSSIRQESPEHYTVTLNIQKLGCAFLPGDHIALLPTNSSMEIANILTLFNVKEDLKLTCSAGWEQTNLGSDICIGHLLQNAQLHPFPRSSLLKLYSIYPSWFIEDIIEQHDEERYDLKTLLELLIMEGYDISLLLGLQKNTSDNLSQILLPLTKRYYSIASYDPQNQYVDLCLRHVYYDSMGDGKIYGTASNWLIHTKPQSIPFYRVASNRFSLPPNPQTPCLMFAAGSGIAPFRSFWQFRAQQTEENKAQDWLFFGSRTQALYKEEWNTHISDKTLLINALCSRVDIAWHTQDGSLIEAPHSKGYISTLLKTISIAPRIKEILMKDPSDVTTPCIYICGQGGFAKDILEALGTIHPQGAQRLIEFHAFGKLKLNIFTTFAGRLDANQEKSISWSEVLKHNHPNQGFWISIHGKVYDIGSYLDLHPGGRRILSLYAGMDASKAFQKVGHHQSPDIMAQLDMFQIGLLKRHSFGVQWSVVMQNGKPHVTTLRQYYQLWIQYLQAIVERENILYAQEALFTKSTALQLHTELNQLLSVDTLFTPLFVTWPQELWSASVSFWAKERSIDTYTKLLQKNNYWELLGQWSDCIQKKKNKINQAINPCISWLIRCHHIQQKHLFDIKNLLINALLVLECYSTHKSNGKEFIEILERLPILICTMLQELLSQEESE